MSAAPSSPYKGLSAFEDSEVDALFFFGRERECEVVVANLIASRLTILYGPSGVGKSSLLSASVARKLRALPEKPLVAVLSRWSEDPVSALAQALTETAGLEPGTAALDALAEIQAARDVYLVFDQLEEHFLYHDGDPGPERFEDVLPSILAAPLRVNVLLSLREDSLAKLDRFAARIPGLFANTLRLDRLDRDGARAAITGPVARLAELTGEPFDVEPALVERVLDEVGSGRISAPLGGRRTVAEESGATHVEAPYLQLVMQRVWDEERASGSATLRAGTLEALGGAQTIVREHMETALGELSAAEQDVASRIFDHLVTPSGMKIAHGASDLASFAGVPLEQLEPVLSGLTTGRILRSFDEAGGARYEIFHDVLADPVLSWRSRHEAERELELQKEAADRRHRRLLRVLAAGAVLLAVMAAITVYALVERGNAQTRARQARAHQLEALSAADLTLDPERSLVLALDAARLLPSDTAAAALRNALLESRVRVVVDDGSPLLAAVETDGAIRAASTNGYLVVADPGTGAIARRFHTGHAAVAASFARDGTAVMTGSDGVVRLVAPGGRVRAVFELAGVDRAVISADGSRLLCLTGGKEARVVETSTGRTLRVLRRPGLVSGAVSANGRRVALGSADERITVYRVGSKAPVRTLPDNAGHPAALAFSPDGRFVAAASTDGLTRIWRFSRGGIYATVPGGAAAVTALGFSTDGDQLSTGSKDGTVRVSKADTGAPLALLVGHDDWISSAVFTGPSGSTVLSASLDGTARIWDATFQPQLGLLARLPKPVSALAFDEDGRVRATTSAGALYVLDPRTGRMLATSQAQRPTERVVGPDGSTATLVGRTVVLEHAGRKVVLRGHRDRVNAVAFSPDGALLASASRDHDVRIWNVGNGRWLRTLQHNTNVRDVAFSPDGRWLVTAAGRATVWDPRTGALVLRAQGHEGQMTAAVFDPSGRYVLTGGVDATVRRYECQVCGSLGALERLAEQRLAITGRELTAEEQARARG